MEDALHLRFLPGFLTDGLDGLLSASLMQRPRNSAYWKEKQWVSHRVKRAEDNQMTAYLDQCFWGVLLRFVGAVPQILRRHALGTLGVLMGGERILGCTAHG